MATRITDAGRVQLIAPGSSPMRPAEYRGVDYRGYTAEAQAAGALGDVISRMSSFAAKLGEQAVGQQAQEDYFAKFQVTAADIRHAKDGDPDNLLIGNDATIYGRTLKKMRAMQLSGMFETEIKSLAAKLKTDAENGLPTANVASQLEAAIASNVDILSKQDPEAAVKLYAASKGYASTAINSAYEYEIKRNKERREAAVTLSNEQENPELTSILNAGITTGAEGTINNISVLDTRRTLRAQQAFGASGQQLMDETIKATDAHILASAQEYVSQYVSASDNPTKAFRDIRNGTTDNAAVNAILTGVNALDNSAAPAWATEMAAKVRDSAKKAYMDWAYEQDQIEKADKRAAELYKVDFTEAMANGDRAGMEQALYQLKNSNPEAYLKMNEDYQAWSNGGSLFSRFDNQSIVEILDRKFNSPYGDPVTPDDVYQVRGQLTQETFRRYLGMVKSFDDDQVRKLKELAVARLEMVPGPLVGSQARAVNARKEKQLADLINKYMSDRIRAARDPNFQMPGPFQWLDANFETSTAASDAQANASLVAKVNGRTYRTEAAFTAAIKEAQKRSDADRVTQLTAELGELREAIRLNLVDEKGNKK